MAEIDREMNELADFAIKSAGDRYKLDLDYSDQSISRLESILDRIYWGFSGRTEAEGEGGLVHTTASIWGSYLGEFMVRKWGGKWNLKGARQIVTINNVDFSPISFVYQRIIGQVRDTVSDYLFDVNRMITPAKPVIALNVPPVVPVKAVTVAAAVPVEKSKAKKKSAINVTLLEIIGAIAGIMLILFLLGFGYYRIRIVGGAAFAGGSPPSPTSTFTLTTTSTSLPTSTITMLPTFTPQPSSTPSPTDTPTLTSTATDTATATPTFTNTPSPTRRRPTWTPSQTPKPTVVYPTNTPVPPTAASTPTNPPPPPPPVTIKSCGVSPSTIEAGLSVILEFSAQFSAPGYGFNIALSPGYPGSSGCSASDTNNDGTASCTGLSGMLPSSTTVNVTFVSPVGNCSASYHTP